MAVEIAYWGPPLSGRTTNLRTLASIFGGYVARDAGIVEMRANARGGELRLKTIQSPLYDEDAYRKLITSAEGFVVVLDAQRWQLDANRTWLALLARLLRETGRSIDAVPLVVQVNKSDTTSALTADELLTALNLEKVPHVTAVAESGAGVEATLDLLLKKLRGESPVVIRRATIDDGSALLDLKNALDHETRMMMFEAGERTTTVDEYRKALLTFLDRSNCGLFVAGTGAQLVGFLEAAGGDFRRNRHSAVIVLGVLEGYRGRGIGKRLLEELEKWSSERGVTRLELTVMAHNERALRLYERAGFVTEGTRRRSLLVDGKWVDEFLMAKVLGE